MVIQASQVAHIQGTGIQMVEVLQSCNTMLKQKRKNKSSKKTTATNHKHFHNQMFGRDCISIFTGTKNISFFTVL